MGKKFYNHFTPGKGDRTRVRDPKAFRDNFDEIDWDGGGRKKKRIRCPECGGCGRVTLPTDPLFTYLKTGPCPVCTKA